ncbi:hypothetical protein LXA43DRAFT_192457 [Ganoderma leucocontextum]|nr:hypothetical protein LXA43DRAFT_192368 [Ganoderma leucocontextum]KAI1784783.1 hypothetical protein LXA43DRAFT_192457 [Ganoderma leucocontextum]
MFTACARKTSRYVLSAHHCNSYNLNPDVITGCRPSTFRQGLKAAVHRADFTAHTTYYHPRCSSSRNFQLPNTLVTHTAPPLAWYFAASPSRFNFNTHLAAHRTCNPRATRSDQHPSRHLVSIYCHQHCIPLSPTCRASPCPILWLARPALTLVRPCPSSYSRTSAASIPMLHVTSSHGSRGDSGHTGMHKPSPARRQRFRMAGAHGWLETRSGCAPW